MDLGLQWYHEWTWLEFSFVSIFILAYVLYLRRFWIVARKLRSRKRLVIIKLTLRTIYFLLIIFALLGPSFGYGKKLVKAIGKDIYLLVDVSKSMDCRDIQPSRLEKVKKELDDFLKVFDSDRVGLITFAGETALKSPLTYDKTALNMFIQTLNTNLFEKQTTDFYEALDLVLQRFTKIENANSEKQAKVVVILSDGEDFSTSTQSILKDFKNQSIRIFTVGVGTITGSKIPSNPQARTYIKEENGKLAISKLNYKKLINIAEVSNGKYFELSSTKKNEMPLLIKTIQDIKGQELDVRSIDVSYNKYDYFLWIALILMVLDFIFVVKVLKI